MKDVVDITNTSSGDSLLLKMRMTKELGFDFSPARNAEAAFLRRPSIEPLSGHEHSLAGI